MREASMSVRTPRRSRRGAAYFLGELLSLVLAASPVFAGGGGENMLLVINPNDEKALRIANAYQQLRHIPDSNILFIAPPQHLGFNPIQMNSTTLFKDTYITPIAQAISSRGLTGQIDYIANIGGPASYSITVNNTSTAQSSSFGLSMLSSLAAGSTFSGLHEHNSALYQGTTSGSPNNSLSYQQGQNNVIRHADSYSGTQYYMAGMVGFTGMFGNTPDQVIANLQRTAAGNGAKPAGTVYFEDNADVRTNARRSQWKVVQDALAARNIPYVQETGTDTPKNKPAVRGAVVGKSDLTLPNGSTYLPGSWADNLTSYGARFNRAQQTKATAFIAAGASGTSGTVVEPGGVASQFPDAAIHLFVADGSTLGEAYAKSVKQPRYTTFIGDLLSQAYADLPAVTLTSAPSDGTTVSGNISIGSTATLASPILATGIKQLKLFVDGKPMGMAINGGSGTFNLDTTALSDGMHELRIVAVNNAAAESENAAFLKIKVNNHGQSVLANNGGSLSATATQKLSIPVNAVAGSATLTRVELRNLGRSLGQTTSATGNIQVDAAKLAYGNNLLTPVAILSNGVEVAGTPITVTRNPDYLAGKTPTAANQRVAGIKAEYFLGDGSTSIAASNFTSVPDISQAIDRIQLRNTTKSELYYEWPLTLPLYHPTSNVDKLAARFSGLFTVTTGEYLFSLYGTNDSARLSIDGISLLAYDTLGGGFNEDISSSVFLSAGEHRFELLTANTGTDGRFDVVAYMRGPDGVTRLLDNTILYTMVPEPTGLVFALAAGTVVLLRRQRNSGRVGLQRYSAGIRGLPAESSSKIPQNFSCIRDQGGVN